MEDSTQENTSTETEAEKETQTTTQEPTLEGFTLADAVAKVKELRVENQTYRTSAKDAQDKLNEISDLYNKGKADWDTNKADFEKKLADLQKDNSVLALQNQLAGKVVDATKAIKLIDESHYDEEGNFQLDKFLEENPFLVVNEKKVSTPANNSGTTQQVDTSKLIEGKDEEWIAEHWDELKKNK